MAYQNGNNATPGVPTNGHLALSQSKRAFQRSLPGRLAAAEDQLDGHDHRLDDLVIRVAAIEARADTADAARVELARQVVDVFRMVFSRRLPRRGPQHQSGDTQLKRSL
jgi:hypothetical protein